MWEIKPIFIKAEQILTKRPAAVSEVKVYHKKKKGMHGTNYYTF